MKILADLHHFDLYYALTLLFEKRLAHQLYRPIGLDWLKENYWDIYAEQPVVDCYLSCIDGKAAQLVSELPPLKNTGWARYLVEMMRIGSITPLSSGIYHVQDKSKHYSSFGYQKAITLDAFKSTKFDLLISSVPQHFERFEQLRKLFQPQAKHIFHMGFGNAPWPVPSGAKNLMLHSMPLGGIPKGVNSIFFHQEFDTDPPVFSFSKSEYLTNVLTYVHFPDSEQLMQETKACLPSSWTFNRIGDFRGPQANIVNDTTILAQMMKSTGFTWHIKPGGESYGHILHNSYAMGRPAIVNADDFKDKMAGAILIDGETCISTSNKSPEQIALELLFYSQPEQYDKMNKCAYNKFKEVVNFPTESNYIKQFLSRLI